MERRIDELLEIFRLLKGKVDVIRRLALARRLEAAKVKAMRYGATASSQELPELSKSSMALPDFDDSYLCPNCQLSLRPFPPASSTLRVCTKCGFVAKSVERPSQTDDCREGR